MSGALAGRVAAVTGSLSGIGRAIVPAFHREGCKVVCADLRPASLAQGEDQSTDEVITKNGDDALFCKTDVTQVNDVEALVRATVDKYGRLDIFVNNAGCAPEILQPAPIWETETSIWDRTHSINSRGVFFGTKYAAGQMVRQEPLANGNRGRIINIASILGLRGTATSDVDTPLLQGAGFMTNPAVKAGIAARHAFGGLGASEDIASAALFLASDKNSWVTGATIPVDGGYVCQ